MKFYITCTAVIFLFLTITMPANAHGVAKVRKELAEQGYSDLEFQRTRPPFKLDGCKDGTIYHLHVDFYGKITEKTPIGDCASEGEDSAASDDGNGLDENVAGQDTGITDQARSRAWRYWGKDYSNPDNGE